MLDMIDDVLNDCASDSAVKDTTAAASEIITSDSQFISVDMNKNSSADDHDNQEESNFESSSENMSHTLLTSIESDLWPGCIVKIKNGRSKGSVGTILGSGNGWALIDMGNEELSRRPHDLELVSQPTGMERENIAFIMSMKNMENAAKRRRSFDNSAFANLNKASNPTPTSSPRLVASNSSATSYLGFNGKKYETIANKDDVKLGSRVQILKVDKVSTKTDYVGKHGNVTIVPAHPSTWFKVRFDNGEEAKFRSSVFRIADDNAIDNPIECATLVSSILASNEAVKNPRIAPAESATSSMAAEEHVNADNDAIKAEVMETGLSQAAGSNKPAKLSHGNKKVKSKSLAGVGKQLVHMKPKYWIGCIVKIKAGRHSGDLAKVLRYGNSWVDLDCEGEKLSKRAHELEVVVLSEKAIATGKFIGAKAAKMKTDMSNVEDSTGLNGTTEGGENPNSTVELLEGGHQPILDVDNDTDDDESQENEEDSGAGNDQSDSESDDDSDIDTRQLCTVGSRIIVVSTDKVSNRIELLGKRGVITELPKFPSSWFQVKFDDSDDVYKFRQSVFDLLDENDNPMNIHGKKQLDEEVSSSRARSSLAALKRREIVEKDSDDKTGGSLENVEIITAPRVRREVMHFNIGPDYNVGSKRPSGAPGLTQAQSSGLIGKYMSDIDPDLWMGCTVEVQKGRIEGELGVVVGTNSGWINIELVGSSKSISRRAAEITLVKLPGDNKRMGTQASTSSSRTKRRGDDADDADDDEDDEEIKVGSKIVIVGTDRVSNRVDLIGRRGIITQLPVFPSSWFKIRFDNGDISKFRQSVFELVSKLDGKERRKVSKATSEGPPSQRQKLLPPGNEKGRGVPGILLSTVDPGDWLKSRVRIIVGRTAGRIGVVTSAANSWITVSLGKREMVSKRSNELELLTDEYEAEEEGDEDDNDEDEEGEDQEEEEDEEDQDDVEPEFGVGSKIRMIGFDKVGNRSDLLGKYGIIVDMPIPPSSWYEIIMDDTDEMVKCRQSIFEVVSDKKKARRGRPIGSGNHSNNLGQCETDEYRKGSRVVITRSDNGAVRSVQYLNKEGYIKELPVYPSTWYTIWFDNGQEAKFRSTGFRLVNSSNSNSSQRARTASATATSQNNFGSISTEQDGNKSNKSRGDLFSSNKQQLLSTLDGDLWVGSVVRILTGASTGREGVVQRTGNGWVVIKTSTEDVTRRSHELELVQIKGQPRIDGKLGRQRGRTMSNDDVSPRENLESNSRSAASREGSQHVHASSDYFDVAMNDETNAEAKKRRVSSKKAGKDTGDNVEDIFKEYTQKRPPIKSDRFIALRRAAIEDYVRIVKDGLQGRPNLTPWADEINSQPFFALHGGFQDRLDQQRKMAREFVDLAPSCRVCYLEKWPSSTFCWNKMCPSSPIYFKLPCAKTNSADVEASSVQETTLSGESSVTDHVSQVQVGESKSFEINFCDVDLQLTDEERSARDTLIMGGFKVRINDRMDLNPVTEYLSSAPSFIIGADLSDLRAREAGEEISSNVPNPSLRSPNQTSQLRGATSSASSDAIAMASGAQPKKLGRKPGPKPKSVEEKLLKATKVGKGKEIAAGASTSNPVGRPSSHGARVESTTSIGPPRKRSSKKTANNSSPVNETQQPASDLLDNTGTFGLLRIAIDMDTQSLHSADGLDADNSSNTDMLNLLLASCNSESDQIGLTTSDAALSIPVARSRTSSVSSHPRSRAPSISVSCAIDEPQETLSKDTSIQDTFYLEGEEERDQEFAASIDI